MCVSCVLVPRLVASWHLHWWANGICVSRDWFLGWWPVGTYIGGQMVSMLVVTLVPRLVASWYLC